jgi:hypothetical protein
VIPNLKSELNKLKNTLKDSEDKCRLLVCGDFEMLEILNIIKGRRESTHG